MRDILEKRIKLQKKKILLNTAEKKYEPKEKEETLTPSDIT